jgi:hypothetical protein
MTAWDGAERPDGAALLDIARRTLLDDIVPGLEGEARLKALMVANALAIALRERQAGGVAEAAAALGDPAALCAAIRRGDHDPGSADHAGVAAALLRLAEAKCRISAPRALPR